MSLLFIAAQKSAHKMKLTSSPHLRSARGQFSLDVKRFQSIPKVKLKPFNSSNSELSTVEFEPLFFILGLTEEETNFPLLSL